VWEHVKEMVQEIQVVLCLDVLFAKKKGFLRTVLLLIPAHSVASNSCEAVNVCKLRQAAVVETIVTIFPFSFG